MAGLYLEDLTPGTTVQGGPVTVSEAEAIAFAHKYDPQPFHTDPVAARQSMFGELILSGWQTALVSMRMLVDSPMAKIANGLVGIEIRKLRLPRPVRPGDVLTVTVEVLETRPSHSQPAFGTAVMRLTTRNQRGEPVLELENVNWVARRPPAT
jgi:acyl dehydratase